MLPFYNYILHIKGLNMNETLSFTIALDQSYSCHTSLDINLNHIINKMSMFLCSILSNCLGKIGFFSLVNCVVIFVISPGKYPKDLPQGKRVAKKADNTTFDAETTKELEPVKVISIHRLGHRMYTLSSCKM